MQVVRYLQHLLTDPLYGISANDIGVVTPYRKQVTSDKFLVAKILSFIILFDMYVYNLSGHAGGKNSFAC